MENIYQCEVRFENDRFLLRYVTEEDVDDLLEVYSDNCWWAMMGTPITAIG